MVRVRYLQNHNRSSLGTLVRFLNISLIPISFTILIITFIIIYANEYGMTRNMSEVCLRNGECHGKTIFSEIAETYHGCMKTCQNQSDCSWISYNFQNKDCHLFSTCNRISFEVTGAIRQSFTIYILYLFLMNIISFSLYYMK